MNEPEAPQYVQAVLPEEISRQRANGWPDFHPETFCHRCGRRNPNWWTDAAPWQRATAGRERGALEILCPSCLCELHEQQAGVRVTWRLIIDPDCGAMRRGEVA